jgi:hypothetical protein
MEQIDIEIETVETNFTTREQTFTQMVFTDHNLTINEYAAPSIIIPTAEFKVRGHLDDTGFTKEEIRGVTKEVLVELNSGSNATSSKKLQSSTSDENKKLELLK